MEKIICSKCNHAFKATFEKRYKRKDRAQGHATYIDEGGRRTYGNVCFKCAASHLFRRLGTIRRSEFTTGKIWRAVQTEKTAEKRFLDLGFAVKRNESATGPDLACRIGDFEWLVEVKPAQAVPKAKNKKRVYSWYTNPVKSARKSDDLIAIVLPRGYTYIDSMENHLRLCNKLGTRCVTSLIKEFNQYPDDRSA